MIVGLSLADDLNAAKLGTGLLWPLLRVMLFIIIGLIAGQVIEVSGWSRYLGALAAPLFRFSNLGPYCSSVFTAAFFSGLVANGMLLNFYKDGTISRRQLFLTNFINQFPAYFLHLPTTFFIVVSLTGWAGIMYFLVTFAATLLRTLIFMLYGRLVLTPSTFQGQPPAHKTNGHKAVRLWNSLKEKLPQRMVNIAIYVIPIYSLVYIVNVMGFFKAARNWMTQYVVTTFIPVEALSVVVLSFAAEFTSGFATAGALMGAGVLTVKQTVLALLIGNIIAFPIRALRHQLPRYIGVFSPKMGTQLLLTGQGFRILSLVFIGWLYYLIF